MVSMELWPSIGGGGGISNVKLKMCVCVCVCVNIYIFLGVLNIVKKYIQIIKYTSYIREEKILTALSPSPNFGYIPKLYNNF